MKKIIEISCCAMCYSLGGFDCLTHTCSNAAHREITNNIFTEIPEWCPLPDPTRTCRDEANERWLEIAQSMGFANEKEMWSCLYPTIWTTTLADMLGYSSKLILFRVKRCGIQTRPRGGNPPSVKAQRGL